MLRIGEFSALSSISINMLRHYDKIGLLIPKHVDRISGYRYYDKDQLVQANRIIALKELGFGLAEIIEAKEMSEDELDKILQTKQNYKLNEIRQLENQIKRIEIALHTRKRNKEYAITVATKIISEMWVASYRGKIKEYSQEGLLWKNLLEECNKNAIAVDQNATAMAANHGIDDESGEMDVEVQLSLGKKYESYVNVNVYKIPERKVASVTFQGSYTQIGDINSFVAEWLEMNQYQIVGEVFSIYHNSPGDKVTEEDYITEICFPIS
jgi:DNA-binding transcriptional MerR regulator/effector-binding domain-containing protein